MPTSRLDCTWSNFKKSNVGNKIKKSECSDVQLEEKCGIASQCLRTSEGFCNVGTRDGIVEISSQFQFSKNWVRHSINQTKNCVFSFVLQQNCFQNSDPCFQCRAWWHCSQMTLRVNEWHHSAEAHISCDWVSTNFLTVTHPIISNFQDENCCASHVQQDNGS